jgi:uncharacterized protein (UPF0335 family)
MTETAENTLLGHNKPPKAPKAGGAEGARLRSYVERIERLEEEKRAIAEDIKEVKIEARIEGFDVKTLTKVVRLRRQDAAQRQAEEETLDLYMHALGMRLERVFPGWSKQQQAAEPVADA